MNKCQKILINDADVTYYPVFFAKSDSDYYLSELMNKITWKQEQVKMFGKERNEARLVSFYGEKSYRYSGKTMPSQAMLSVLKEIKYYLDSLCQVQFNGVLLNLYRDGKDYLGWHSDDEKDLVENSAIVSLSFGDTRRFLLRRKDDKSIKVELKLNHGDLLIMQGDTQKFWQHQIAKTKKQVNPRINLTFRLLK